jgi:hypothetical protein
MNFRRFVTRAILLRVVRATAIAVALYALLGFLVIPRVARSVAESKLTALLHRQVSIGKVSLNPFTFGVTIDGFAVRDRQGGPFVAFDQLYLDLQAASVIHGGVILREITLRGPAITIVRETPDTYGFSDLIDQFSGGPPPDPNAKPTRYSLNNIRVVGGSVDFVDKPKNATHTVRKLELAVPFLSNLPYDLESYVQPSFSAVVNGTPFGLQGRTRPFSETHEAAFDIELADLSIPTYMEYVPVALRFTIPSGSVDTKVALSFEQPEGRAPVLSVSGHVALKNLAARDLAGKPIVTLPLVDVMIGKSDVLGGKLVLDAVRIDRPDLRVVRGADGIVNLAELGPKPDTAPPATPIPPPPAPPVATPDAKPAAPLVIELTELHLVDGTVHFSDVAPAGPFETTLTGLTIDARHFSTEPGKSVAVDVRLRTEAGETVHDTSEVTLVPLRVTTHAQLTGIVLHKYAPYYAKSVLLDLDDGKLDLDAKVALDLAGTAPRITVSDVDATVTGLRAHKRGEARPLVSFDSFGVKEASIDLGKRSVVLGQVSGSKGRVEIARAHDGTLNLATLVPPSAPGKREAAPATPPPPWSLVLDKLALDGWAVRFEDRVPEKPVVLAIEPLSVTVDHFSLAKGSRFNVGLRASVNRRGTVTASGNVVLEPLTASLKVDGKAIDLLPVQPYFTDKVNLLLTSGSVTAAGDVTLATGPSGLRATYKGRAGIDKLTAVEKATSEDFLKWDALFLGGVDFTSDPPALSIAEVSLSTFYSRLAINADATLNLRGIMVPPGQAQPGGQGATAPDGAPAAVASASPPSAAEAPVAAAQEPSMPIRIDKVTLQGGVVDFADRLVKPNFSTSLRELGGRLTGLSTDEASTADLDLRAKLEDYAPLEISGKVNPLAKELAIDIKIAFHDIDVSPLSPYSGKYVGYTISKGKLFLDLNYTIAKRQLVAKNTLFVDQLTLGDPVESPTATKLPVRLALALLKDRKGEIHIDLPLHGSLDDPKFSIGGIVLDALENIIVKAVTAPFALLGSIFGHGEDLSSIEFDEGRATLGPAGMEKVKTLVKALTDRPALKMDITGYVDPVTDGDGLRRVRFERKLKSQKLKAMTDQGVTVGASVDDLTLEPDEYARLLELAYKAETFPKPRNVLGMAKDLPGPEMEKLMLTHLTVTDDDLRAMAQQRADEVKNQLTKSGVAGERLFVVEPKQIAAVRKEGLKNSRVDFVLR